MTAITKDQAQALAALVATLRPDWDAQGVMAALSKARDRGNAYELAHAAIAAAATPTNRTPAVIGMAGAHWEPPAPAAPSQVPPAGMPRCAAYGHDHETAHNCRTCRAEYLETGIWPAGTQHHAATPTRPVCDVRTLAAGDDG